MKVRAGVGGDQGAGGRVFPRAASGPPFGSSRPRVGVLAGPLCHGCSPFRSSEEAGAGEVGFRLVGGALGAEEAGPEGRPGRPRGGIFHEALSCGSLPACSDLTSDRPGLSALQPPPLTTLPAKFPTSTSSPNFHKSFKERRVPC